MTSDNLNRRPVVAAAIAATVMMLVFGLTHLVLATILYTPVTTVPIAPDALDGLPLQIGDWTGVDVPLDKSIVRRTDSDAYINRRYSRGNGLGSISLYVCCGVNIRMLIVHRPQNCYSAAGWTLADRRSLVLQLNDRIKLPCSIFQFSRGDLNREEVTVLHYFITDGQYHDSISMLRSRLWHLFTSVQWVAQVQIIASSGGTITPDAMIKKNVSDFAVDSASSIAELFEHIQKDQSVHSTHPLKEGGSR